MAKQRISFEVVYEDARAVYAYRASASTPSPDTFAFRALWAETLRLLVIERFFPGDDDPAEHEIVSFDNVSAKKDALRIARTFADFEAERQLYNAGKVSSERLRMLDRELEELCGRVLLPWIRELEPETTEQEDDGSQTLH